MDDRLVLLDNLTSSWSLGDLWRRKHFFEPPDGDGLCPRPKAAVIRALIRQRADSRFLDLRRREIRKELHLGEVDVSPGHFSETPRRVRPRIIECPTLGTAQAQPETLSDAPRCMTALTKSPPSTSRLQLMSAG